MVVFSIATVEDGMHAVRLALQLAEQRVRLKDQPVPEDAPRYLHEIMEGQIYRARKRYLKDLPSRKGP